MPKISVIVPVYKAEKYLERCVDSILAQTFADFELILVNDGSPDSSGAICDAYTAKDSRVKVIHKENGGVSAARNTGLDAAKGEFVAFVDSDDYVEPDYLRVLLWNDCDLSLCGNYKHLPDGVVITEHDLQLSACAVTTVLLESMLSSGKLYTVWGKAFRRSLLQQLKLRFREDICYSEDTIFAMTFAAACETVCCHKEPLYHYVKYAEGTLSRQITEKSLRSVDTYDRFIGAWLREQNISDTWYQQLACPSKGRLRYMFFKIFGNPSLSGKEKAKWYRLFFSLRSFVENRKVLLFDQSARLQFVVGLRCPWALVAYEALGRKKRQKDLVR